MALPVGQIVVDLKAFIRSYGSNGCRFHDAAESLNLLPSVAYFVAQRYLAGSDIVFTLAEKTLDPGLFAFDQFLLNYDSIHCSSAPADRMTTCSIVDPDVIGDDEGLADILDAVTGAGPRGCTTTELSGVVISSHMNIDKLVGMGYLTKQSIMPIANVQNPRTDCKTVVMHSKRYAPFYEEVADGMKVLVGSGYLERLHDLIVDLLDRKGVRYLPSRDIAKGLGMSRWDLQSIRNATIAQGKKEPTKVAFFQRMCSRRDINGVMSVQQLTWCGAKAIDCSVPYLPCSGKGSGAAVAFSCPRNQTVHATVSAVLNDSVRGATGISASDIRTLTGASYKRAAKLFAEFHKTFGYPLEKIQEGKQLKYKVLPKYKPEEVPLLQEEAVNSGDIEDSAGAVSTSVKFSDQQRLNCEVIEQFLRQNDGVASVAEIVSAVRSESRRRQQEHAQLLGHSVWETGAGYGNTTMDKRTIERTVNLLEHHLQRVVTRQVSDAANGGGVGGGENALVLVLLRDGVAGSDTQRISDYFARLAAATREGQRKRPIRGRGRPRKTSRASAGSDSGVASEDSAGSACSSDHANSTSGEEDFQGNVPSDAPMRERKSKGRRQKALVPVEEDGEEERHQRRTRILLLGQRRRNDDPALFNWQLSSGFGSAVLPVPLGQLCGRVVSAVCLHYHLVQLTVKRDAGQEEVHERTEKSVELMLDSLVPSLPFEYFLLTSESLRASLERTLEENGDGGVPSALRCEVEEAVRSGASLGDLLETKMGPEGASKGILATALTGCLESCREELLMPLCLLLALGVLRLSDHNAHTPPVGTGADTMVPTASTQVLQRGAPFDGSPQLHALVNLYQRVAVEDGAARTEAVALLTQRGTLLLGPVPLGSWRPVCSALDVYHHWRTVLLPCLPMDWTWVSFERPVTNLGLHLFRFWEVQRPGDLPPDTPRNFNRGLFTGGAVRMDIWGNAVLQKAWENAPGFTWADLLAPAHVVDRSVSNESGGKEEIAADRSATFSLDMPRRTSTKRKGVKRSLTDGPSASDEPAIDSTGAPVRLPGKQPKQHRSSAVEEVGDPDLLNAASDQVHVSEPSGETHANSCPWRLSEDAQLKEEVALLNAQGDSANWTAAEVAVVLEVVLIHYFVREMRADAVPVQMRAQVPAGGSVSVSPGGSLFDIDWAETDFSMVAECGLSTAVAASGLPDLKMARHRVLQCVRYRPSFRAIAAWVLCNKGRRTSNAFVRALNEALLKADTRSGDDHREQRQQAWTLLMQSYAEPGTPSRPFGKQQMDSFQQLPFSSVAAATREMVVRGLLRQARHCGSPACSAQPSSCKHSKRSFDLTGLFAELQSDVPWAGFYKCLMVQHPLQTAESAPQADASPFSSLMARVDSISCRLLLLASLLSRQAHVLCTTISAQAAEGEIAVVEEQEEVIRESVVCTRDPTSNRRHNEVLLLGPVQCDDHSGFCEKALNDVSAMVTAADQQMLTVGEGNRAGVVSVSTITGIATGDHFNPELRALFTAKVLAVLSARPGATLGVVHTALATLSKAQVQSLLHNLHASGLVQQRAPKVSVSRPGPFARCVPVVGDTGYFVGSVIVR